MSFILELLYIYIYVHIRGIGNICLYMSYMLCLCLHEMGGFKADGLGNPTTSCSWNSSPRARRTLRRRV